jgi:flagellar motor switch protein FliG
MSNLGSVSATLIEKLLVDFVSQMSGTGSLMGSYESTERLLANILPQDKVGVIMEEIRGPAGRTMWDKLANVNETVLANYLKNEYPQTVSVVLSKIKPEHAARVLAALPEEFALEVVQRMLRMESVQKDILDKVEQTLRVEFMSNLARTAKRDAHEQMAEIFNNFDRQTESRFVTALEERNRDSAERIKALMFTFEDLAKLDPGSIQTLLRNVEKDKLGLALKGATDGLRDVFFTNMSERAGKILRDDMEAMGPVRLKDVDEAQMRMVNVAKDLANKGEIMIATGSGEDELVY